MADDATERLLKEQARAHGLDAYAPEPEGVAPKTIAYAIRQDAERDEAALRGFAGLRGSSFEIGAQWSAAPAPPAPAPIGLDLTAFENVAALAAEGLDALKAELTRRGAKAGGTADERAARLWRIRGLAPGAALPADLRAKQKRPKPPAKTEDEPTARARRGPAAPPKPRKRRKKQQPQGHLIATSTFSKKERGILDFAGTSSRR
jgi:hypothetical protein